MAPLPLLRVALLVSFSVFLTVVLGFGLPALLNVVARACGFPETSVTECIVLLYLVFVVYVATPRIPRGLVEVRNELTDCAEELCEVVLFRKCPAYSFDVAY